MKLIEYSRQTVVTAAAEEPVTLTEVKEALGITHTEFDAVLVSAWIPAARDHAESYLNRAIINRTVDVFAHRFGPQGIKLPGGLQSISSVSYYDSDNVQQTLAASNYQHDLQYSRLILSYTGEWPDTYERLDAVTIRAVSGMGTLNSIPPAVKQAVLLLVGHFYENREATTPLSLNVLPIGVESLLYPYRWLAV